MEQEAGQSREGLPTPEISQAGLEKVLDLIIARMAEVQSVAADAETKWGKQRISALSLEVDSMVRVLEEAVILPADRNWRDVIDQRILAQYGQPLRDIYKPVGEEKG